MYATLDLAKEVAIRVHSGQFDKSGEPYIEHPFRVMCMCKTDDERIVAVLHDVVEDGAETIESITSMFRPDIGAAINLLAHRKGDSYVKYVHKIRVAAGLALIVKRFDIIDNLNFHRMMKLDSNTRKRLLVKYYRGMRVLSNKEYTNRIMQNIVLQCVYKYGWSEDPVHLSHVGMIHDILNGKKHVNIWGKKEKLTYREKYPTYMEMQEGARKEWDEFIISELVRTANEIIEKEPK